MLLELLLLTRYVLPVAVVFSIATGCRLGLVVRKSPVKLRLVNDMLLIYALLAKIFEACTSPPIPMPPETINAPEFVPVLAVLFVITID